MAVFFDKDLKQYEYLAVHPNDNTATIWMKTDVLVQIIKDHGNSFDWISIGS